MVMMLKTSRLLGEEGIEFFYTKDEHTNMNIISKLMLGGGGGGGCCSGVKLLPCFIHSYKLLITVLILHTGFI